MRLFFATEAGGGAAGGDPSSAGAEASCCPPVAWVGGQLGSLLGLLEQHESMAPDAQPLPMLTPPHPSRP